MGPAARGWEGGLRAVVWPVFEGADVFGEKSWPDRVRFPRAHASYSCVGWRRKPKAGYGTHLQ